MNVLPQPGPHNDALREIIHARIEAEGPMRFSDFLRLDLYHPEHGYYMACDPTLDYQSSPNVHPVFGASIAKQIAGFWREMGGAANFTVFEAAAGNGRLCADVLSALRASQPDLYQLIRYVQQDSSLSGETGRQKLLNAGVPEDKTDIAEALPETASIEGSIISNELLDALPFDRIRKRDGVLHELRVGFQDGRFVDVECELPPELRDYFDALGVEPAEGCDAEVSLEARNWMAKAMNALTRGYILTLDYGYDAPDLYAAWRKRGTLLTFYRQTSDEDPYARIGRQDITASVDFTIAKRIGEMLGLRTVVDATQSAFLATLGIGDALTSTPAATDLEAFYALRRGAIELTDPAGLGRIRVLIQSKGV